MISGNGIAVDAAVGALSGMSTTLAMFTKTSLISKALFSSILTARLLTSFIIVTESSLSVQYWAFALRTVFWKLQTDSAVFSVLFSCAAVLQLLLYHSCPVLLPKDCLADPEYALVSALVRFIAVGSKSSVVDASVSVCKPFT